MVSMKDSFTKSVSNQQISHLPPDKIFLELRPEVKVTVKTVCDTPQPQDVFTHLIWDSYLK